MRLGPFELRRVTAAAQTAPAEKGASGTVIQDGYITKEEWNPDLRGKEALKTYRKMRRSDASVREAEQHILAPIKNATWEIEPYSDDEDDLRIAAAVRAAYFEWPTRPFTQHLHQALTALAYGFQVFEYAWQVVEAEVEYDDPETGEPTVVPTAQYLTWSHFAQRLPETIWKWNMRDGALFSVTQQALKDGLFGEFEMPSDDLLVFTNEMEGDDFEGESLLRSSYAAWFLKRLVERVAGAAVERQGLGVWIVYPPESSPNDTAEFNRLEEILTAVGLGDSPYIISPGPKQQGETPGYLFELVSTAGAIESHIKFLEYLRGEIKGNVLARFAELGHGRTGARATGDVQSEVWYDALHATANWFAEVHNSYAIPRFVRVNFNSERFPKLVVQNIESKSLEEFANSNAKLVASGAVIADKPYRDFVRREIGSPDEDDATAEEMAETEIEEEPPPPASDEPSDEEEAATEEAA